MWKLKSSNAHIMIPLFHNVEPSHVRHGKGPYAEAFNKHETQGRCLPDVITGWRGVLREVSCLSGWSLEATSAGYEGKLVDQVVKDVLQSLDFGMLEVAQHSVGVEPRSDEVRQLLKLDDETSDRLTLGIWGIAGLGKTNLSKALYNDIRHLFQAASFVSNVNLEDSRHGIIKLQQQILKDLLKTKIKLNNLDHGNSLMRNRLASLKALVVLDNIDNVRQLDALMGDWFGKGSRIIITTRDKRVLDLRQVDIIYPMRGLELGEAVELFSWNAFHRARPERDYEDMTERIVKTCSGLPLSLKIIGTDLYNRDKISYWPEVVNKLENVGHDVVFETLKISYNNLAPVEKHIFLDIACFFVEIKRSDFTQNRAFSKDFYARFWSVLGCESVFTSLKILEEKALIVIYEERYNEAIDDGLDEEDKGAKFFWEFSMHDQIRDMGRRIVREESWNDPTKRSRVWREEDIRSLMSPTTIQGFPNLEQLDLTLSSEVAGELQPLIGQKNLTLSFNFSSCVAAFFCFDIESEENAHIPELDVLMTYLDDFTGALLSKTFEVPSRMKGVGSGRFIMRVCIWHIESFIERGMSSCSYSVRDESAQNGSQVFLRQVEFLVLEGNATSQDAIQFLEQWKLLSSSNDNDV